MLAKRVSIINFKGGVGKTTLAIEYARRTSSGMRRPTSMRRNALQAGNVTDGPWSPPMQSTASRTRALGVRDTG